MLFGRERNIFLTFYEDVCHPILIVDELTKQIDK